MALICSGVAGLPSGPSGGNGAFEYADWKLGITKAFDNGFSVGLAYTGTDADDALYVNPYGNKTARDTVALTVTKAF